MIGRAVFTSRYLIVSMVRVAFHMASVAICTPVEVLNFVQKWLKLILKCREFRVGSSYNLMLGHFNTGGVLL